jgi:hypothetical protein
LGQDLQGFLPLLYFLQHFLASPHRAIFSLQLLLHPSKQGFKCSNGNGVVVMLIY